MGEWWKRENMWKEKNRKNGGGGGNGGKGKICGRTRIGRMGGRGERLE